MSENLRSWTDRLVTGELLHEDPGAQRGEAPAHPEYVAEDVEGEEEVPHDSVVVRNVASTG